MRPIRTRITNPEPEPEPHLELAEIADRAGDCTDLRIPDAGVRLAELRSRDGKRAVVSDAHEIPQSKH